MIHYRVMSDRCKEDVGPGISSVCFVVLLRDDTEDGVDVPVYCCEARTTL